MNRKMVSGITPILLLVGTLTFVFDVQRVKASGTIYIRTDGSVEPPDAPISSVDNITYTFMADIYDSIVVERDNIVIDGAGHTVKGTGDGKGLDLSGEWPVYRNNVTVINTKITGFETGIYLDISRNCNVSSNTVASNTLNGIHIGSSSSSNTFRGNKVQNNTGNHTAGIIVMGSNNTLRDNTISNNDNGIRLVARDNNNLSGNTVLDNAHLGIEVQRSDNNVLSGNMVSNNSVGITLSMDSEGNMLSENTVANNSHAGIHISSSHDNVISGNTVLNNSRDGISVYWTSENNVISGNVISNSRHGIIVVSSENNTVSGNTILNNTYGCRIIVPPFPAPPPPSGPPNRLYHNNFINNSVSASTNLEPSWDDGYPSGGNYWSDYNGTDSFSGPCQNVTGCDGIGDIPYIVNEKNRDNYPLMNPWPDVTPPNITILSPENTTYATTSVPLTFTINECCPWIGYSLDNQANVTITGNTTLTDLAEGSHSILVYANDTSGNMGASTKIFFTITLPQYTLTIYSSPTGIPFTVDGVSHTTPWSGTYDDGTSVSLEMPKTHSVGDAEYHWDQWNDGVTSRSRTVPMNTNVTLTAYYTGPYYKLTVDSSPKTGVTFTIDGTPETTPYTEWLLEGSYTLEMPETHNRYFWSHWLEDGDIHRTKTVTLPPESTWTGVYTSISWEYVFEDERRDTALRISTDDRCFQFIAPDKIFSIKHDPNMTVEDRFVAIHFEDDEIILDAIAVIKRRSAIIRRGFCKAIATDAETGTQYFLIDAN